MARRRLEGLERVLGVNALFFTAYGNVGSSSHYIGSCPSVRPERASRIDGGKALA